MDQTTQEWVSSHVSNAVYDLMDQGVLEDFLVEAKPAWVLPMTLIIGKARVRGSANRFYWFLCGDAPTMAAEGTVAATPRLAARHFSYQWQLKLSAENNGDASELQKAESLYELTEMDQFWNETQS